MQHKKTEKKKKFLTYLRSDCTATKGKIVGGRPWSALTSATITVPHTGYKYVAASIPSSRMLGAEAALSSLTLRDRLCFAIHNDLSQLHGQLDD